jgi:mitochondrial intermembrane space import and assembly protein 40
MVGEPSSLHYWMLTSITVFRPEPLIPPPAAEDAPTLESLAAERKARKAREVEQLAASAAKAQSEDGSPSPADPAQTEGESEEESQAGAFNPETGEINWDCPCLGGMADGPCGENFKAAFSCFVFSQEEPKGMDCIDKFK